MKRREFLGRSVETASALIAGWTLLTPALARAAESQGLPVTELRKSLPSNQALILLPEDSEYARYLASYNLRTHQAPQLRVLPRNAEGVQAVIVWARKNQIPFAVRCGGHSYEGLSQSRSVVIDVRLLKSINLSGDKKSVDVGSGCALGDVYQALGVHELAIPAGSCPSVGVSGHTLGGGYGLLARPFGLACDSLIEIELVDADGKILIASENRNADLFWACRGGGAGSFGVVTRLKFKTHSVKRLEVFGLGWSLSPDEAASVFGTWQSWASEASSNLTSIFKIQSQKDGKVQLRCMGQSIGSESELRSQLSALMKASKVTSELQISAMSFLKAVAHFGSEGEPKPDFMKGKCDYVRTPITRDGMRTLFKTQGSLATRIAITCDSYGGSISDVAPDATAFAHRAGTLFSMKYSTHWKKASETRARVRMSEFFMNRCESTSQAFRISTTAISI